MKTPDCVGCFLSLFGLLKKSASFNGCKKSVLKSFIFFIKPCYHCLDLFSFGMTVLGTKILNKRQIVFAHKVTDILFLNVYHRANKRQVLTGKISYRQKRTEPPLVKEVKHKGLYDVVVMMTECELVTAKLLCRVVKNTAAHFGA